MKNILFTTLIIFALALAALGPAPALAEDGKYVHAVQKTLIPGTVYYFPDGRASADSAWIKIGSYKNTPSYWSLYAVMDSTLGFDDPCTLRVECYYGLEDWAEFSADTMRVDSMAFLGYPSTTVVFNEPFHIVPEDSSRLISCGVYLHDEHRWRVTVSDSCTLTLLEKVGKP